MKKNQIVLLTILFKVFMSTAQEKDSCKVLLKEISGIYQGACENGLANGKGFSKGEDSYQGMFKNGLPEGKGEYRYKNGNKFIGFWFKGLKEGEGKFFQSLNGKINIIKGYWQNGDYIGPLKPSEPYRVNVTLGIGSYSIDKADDSANQIEILIIGAMTKYVPPDLTIETTSGQLIQEGKSFSIYNYNTPNRCAVLFTIKTSGGDKKCNFTFEILRPGKYKVAINNN